VTSIGLSGRVILVLLVFVPSHVWSQSRNEGWKLFDAGVRIFKTAQNLGDYDKALEKWQQALNVFEKIKFKDGMSKVQNNLGAAYYNLGQLDKAMECFRGALLVAKELKDRKSECYALNNVGEIYKNKGLYFKAIEYYDKALPIAKRLGDRRQQGVTLTNIGEAYAALARQEDSVKAYEEALRIARRVRHRDTVNRTLSNLGLIYDQGGKYEKAIGVYKGLIRNAKARKDHIAQARILNSLGEVYDKWGKHEKAVDCYEKALRIAVRQKNRTRQGWILNNLGITNKNWGKLDQAATYYEQALSIAKDLGNRTLESAVASNLGNVYVVWGKYDKAANLHRKLVDYAQERNDRSKEAGALTNLAGVYLHWGKYHEAEQLLEEALDIARATKDRRGEATVLDNLGSTSVYFGRDEEAAASYGIALSIARDLRDSAVETRILSRFGDLYRDRGDLGKALEYYLKSLEVARQSKSPRDEANILGSLGVVRMEWGQYEKALEYYKKSLEISRELKDRKAQGVRLLNIGEIHRSFGKHDRALESFQQGLALWGALQIPVHWPRRLLGMTYLEMGDLEKAEPLIRKSSDISALGRLHLANQDYEKAVQSYDQFLEIAQEMKRPSRLFIAHTGLGRAYEGLKEYQKAAIHYGSAVKIVETSRLSLSQSDRKGFFNVKLGGFSRTEPHEGLARVLMMMNKPLESFRASEQTKARVFSESISRNADLGAGHISQEDLKQDIQLNDQLIRLNSARERAFEKGDRQLISSLEPQIEKLEKKLALHMEMIRKQYPLFAATKYSQTVGLDKALLKEDEWALTYDVTDRGTIVYLTKGTKLVKATFKPVPRKDLDELVRKFREPMEIVPGKERLVDKLKSFDFASGLKLSQILLGDLLDDIPECVPLIIVPDDSLGVLPFEMLVLNGEGEIATDKDIPYVSGAEFFGDRNSLSYYQSVTALTLAKTLDKKKGSERRLLVIADPVFGMGDPRLHRPASNTEVTGLQAEVYKDLMVAVEDGEVGTLRFDRLALNGDLARDLSHRFTNSCDVYTGTKASKRVFLNRVARKLPEYGTIVFATHGYFGQDLPGLMEPVLVLSLVPPGTDGYLRMSEVMGLKMTADLVALTACQTGLGRTISGEGVMGMGRAFQYAGARSVLMSLWSVAQASSVKLMEGFFRHLNKGKSKLDALRLARKEIRDAGFDHPFFWAPFIVVGEVRPDDARP
jgi:tetratricopeptide (TPR) repeat protein